MEEAAFFYYYKEALENVNISKRKHILDLGVNRGDEFEVIRNMVDAETFASMQLAGIDHSESALFYANTQFPEENVRFVTTLTNWRLWLWGSSTFSSASVHCKARALTSNPF